MRPEGELRVALSLRDGRVAGCDIVSTRPDVARLLLQGRRPAEVVAALPRLFAICGASQAAAGELALAAAAGRDIDTRAAATAVADETLRETAHRVLLDWPRVIGEAPAPEAVAAVRAARQPRPDAAARAAIGQAVFGMPAERWLELDSAQAHAQWQAEGRSAAARFVALAAAETAAPAAADGVALLAGVQLGEDAEAWLQPVEHEPSFIHAPLWRGAPVETGPLARWPQDTLLRALAAAGAGRPLLRLAARLRELAWHLGGEAGKALASGALRIREDTGLGWVENARGLLIHVARVRDDRAMLYRIVAPTDWNFHPQGALAHGLRGRAGDAPGLERRARLLVDSLDPCVACGVETRGA